MKNALGDALEDSLERAKWKHVAWQIEEAPSKLELIRSNVTDEKKRSKLNGLYKYINGNKAHIVNYDERKRTNKTYTNQVAESHIESVINARYKSSGKIQWMRKGAHNVLQIRAIITDKAWESRWQGAVLSALGVVV